MNRTLFIGGAAHRAAELHRLILEAHRSGVGMVGPAQSSDLCEEINVSFHAQKPDFSPEYVAKMYAYCPQPQEQGRTAFAEEGEVAAMTDTPPPPPGSPQAQALGCSCPGLKWSGFEIYVMQPDCPLHGEAADPEKADAERTGPCPRHE